MVGAAIAVYGPRTTIIAYNTNSNTVEEWTLRIDNEEREYWELSRENLRVNRETRYFSPGNTKSIIDNISYRQTIEFWSRSAYNLRFTNALSADAAHLLIKGEGILTSFGSK